MSSSISTLFKGLAHFKVLEILCSRTEPVRLRTLAELSGMYVRSIELTLSHLVKERVVLRIKKNGVIRYALNPSHPQVPLLLGIFRLVKEAEMETRRSKRALDKRAQAVLAFCDSAIQLFQKAHS